MGVGVHHPGVGDGVVKPLGLTQQSSKYCSNPKWGYFFHTLRQRAVRRCERVWSFERGHAGVPRQRVSRLYVREAYPPSLAGEPSLAVGGVDEEAAPDHIRQG